MKRRFALLFAFAFYVSILSPLAVWADLIKGNFSDIITKGPWVDVRSQPTAAVPNDNTDDYAAFASAISGGGHIKVPPGWWDIELSGTTPWLALDNATWIEGAGVGKSILNVTGDNTAYRELFRINGKEEIEISGFTIYMNRTPSRVGTAIDVPIYVIGDSTALFFQDLDIHGSAMDAIYFSTTTPGHRLSAHVSRVTIDNAARNAIAIVNGSYLWFDEIYVTNTNGSDPEAALDIEPTTGYLVHHVWFDRSHFAGENRSTVKVGNGTGQTRDIWLDRSTVLGGALGYATLAFDDNPGTNENLNFSNGIIDNCVQWCFRANGTKHSSLTGTKIRNSDNTATDSAVLITKNSLNKYPRDFTLDRNTITDAAWFGVEGLYMVGSRISRNEVLRAQKHGMSLSFGNNLTTEWNSVTAASQTTHNTWDGIAQVDMTGSTTVNNTIRNSEVWARGTAVAGGTDNITLDNTATPMDDLYTGSEIYIVSGTSVGETKTITDYVGLTRVATVDTAWSVTPDNTSVYWIRGVKRHRYAISNAQLAALAGGYNRIESNDTLEGSTNAKEVFDGSTTQIGNMVLGRTLVGSKTWAPGSIADAATAVDNVTVLGAAVGDLVTSVSHDNVIVGGVQLTGTVVAADTVTVTMRNQTGGAYDPGTGTLRVFVRKVN